MTGRITKAGAEYFIATLFGQTQEPAESYWVGLAGTISPTIFANGSELNEPDSIGSGYVRKEIPNNVASWASTGDGLVRSNNVALTWPAATTDWGQIKYWALCSAEIEGLIYAYGSLTTPVDVNPTDIVVLGVGQLAFSADVLYQVG